MTKETLPTQQLTQLNFEIEQAEADASCLKAERGAVARAAASAARRLNYLRFARWFRSPSASLRWWPLGTLIIGSGVFGTFSFVFAHSVYDSFPPALLAYIIGIALGAAIIGILLYVPSNTHLETNISEAEAKSRLERARFNEKMERLTEVTRRLQRLVDERSRLIASGKLQRAALLQREWKAMRGNEWEDYLVEVCQALGANVERTGQCGDQGCDLIVEFGTKRIAVQAKGFDGIYAVNHKAVQEAYAGMAHRSCSSCAVITNTRFRRSAKELASSTHCALIGVDEFPDFVMGNIEL